MARSGRPRLAGARYPSGKLKPPPKPPLGHFIYVMMSRAAFLKIGKTTKPAQRADAIRGSEGILVHIAWLGKSESAEDISRLEAAVHRRLKDYREHVVGEWYRLDVDAAIAAVKQTAQEMGIAIQYGEEADDYRASRAYAGNREGFVVKKKKSA